MSDEEVVARPTSVGDILQGPLMAGQQVAGVGSDPNMLDVGVDDIYDAGSCLGEDIEDYRDCVLMMIKIEGSMEQL